ncbi:MAG: S8 family serine peptidase [Methylococcaceae bacterium]|nr:S8 family serine peptidase [Methylococcaceae bacterium]
MKIAISRWKTMAWLILSAGLLCALVSCAPAKQTLTDAHGNHKLLVTFKDERENRPPIADPVNAYRQRGGYGNTSWSRQVAESLARDYGMAPVAQWPIDTLAIHCVVYWAPMEQPLELVINRLRQDPRVESVQLMQQFRAMGQTYSDPYYRLQSDMRDMHIESAHRMATGRNVRVAVIDTGVDAHHPDIVGQVALAENFVADFPETAEDIHGTAVAGIIAASANNRQGIVGIAPDAKLLALKACWQIAAQKSDAACNSFTLALALNAAIKLKPGIVNLSLAGPHDPLLERLIDKALDEGVIVIASVPSKTKPNENFPASMKRVIAVRSAHEESQDSPREPVISAPGQEILTTLPHASYNFMSGSSFAAAHVSGLAALLLELRPTLSSEQMAAILLASLHRPTPDQPFRSVDACSAVSRVNGTPGCLADAKTEPKLAAPNL